MPQDCSRHCSASFPFFRVPQNVVPLPARVSLLSRICAVTGYLDRLQRGLYHRLTELLSELHFHGARSRRRTGSAVKIWAMFVWQALW